MAACQHSQSNLVKLERLSQEEWETLPKDKLVGSLPRRLEAILAAKGALTKYSEKDIFSWCERQSYTNIFLSVEV